MTKKYPTKDKKVPFFPIRIWSGSCLISFFISQRCTIDTKPRQVSIGLSSPWIRRGTRFQQFGRHLTRQRPVQKDMAQMRVTSSASTFQPSVEFSLVRYRPILDGSPKGRPSAARIVLGIGIKQVRATIRASKGTVLLAIIQRAGPGGFSEAQTQDQQSQWVPRLDGKGRGRRFVFIIVVGSCGVVRIVVVSHYCFGFTGS